MITEESYDLLREATGWPLPVAEFGLKDLEEFADPEEYPESTSCSVVVGKVNFIVVDSRETYKLWLLAGNTVIAVLDKLHAAGYDTPAREFSVLIHKAIVNLTKDDTDAS